MFAHNAFGEILKRNMDLQKMPSAKRTNLISKCSNSSDYHSDVFSKGNPETGLPNKLFWS